MFHNTTPDLQDQDQDRFSWSQTGFVLRPTVSDHITDIGYRLKKLLNVTELRRLMYFNTKFKTVAVVKTLDKLVQNCMSFLYTVEEASYCNLSSSV